MTMTIMMMMRPSRATFKVLEHESGLGIIYFLKIEKLVVILMRMMERTSMETTLMTARTVMRTITNSDNKISM